MKTFIDYAEEFRVGEHEQEQPLFPGPRRRTLAQQIDEAVDQQLAKEARLFWRAEAAYNRMLADAGGVLRGVHYSFETRGWAYWLLLLLLLPAYIGFFGGFFGTGF